MIKTHPISAKEKLRLLQESDHWRTWQSLADERQCILCERTFTGRELHTADAPHGRLLFHCPTPGCTSGPREWIHPGNPLTDDLAWQDWQRILEDSAEDNALSAQTSTRSPRSMRVVRVKTHKA
jgi:hypothetical protein